MVVNIKTTFLICNLKNNLIRLLTGSDGIVKKFNDHRLFKIGLNLLTHPKKKN